jgi:hypothetical protein
VSLNNPRYEKEKGRILDCNSRTVTWNKQTNKQKKKMSKRQRSLDEISAALDRVQKKQKVLLKKLHSHPDYPAYVLRQDIVALWCIMEEMEGAATRSLGDKSSLEPIKQTLLDSLTVTPTFKKKTKEGRWGFARKFQTLSYKWRGVPVVYTYSKRLGDSAEYDVRITIGSEEVTAEDDVLVIDAAEGLAAWLDGDEKESLVPAEFVKSMSDNPKLQPLLLYAVLISIHEPSSREHGYDFSFLNDDDDDDD